MAPRSSAAGMGETPYQLSAGRCEETRDDPEEY